MCNVAPDIMAKLEQTVRQFLDQGRMFTGYDVTIETRQREDLKLRHNDCRGAVHEMQFLNDAVEFGHDINGQTVSWGKTQVNMNGNGWAFVYHPKHIDPQTYQPQTTQAASAPRIPVAAVATSPVSVPAVVDDADDKKDSGGQNSDGTFQTDYRNRLFIPTRFVRDLGLKAGDTIYIVVDDSRQTISMHSDTPQSQTSFNSQVVERNGDLRLSGAVLRQAGLTGSKFKIEQSNGVLEVFSA